MGRAERRQKKSTKPHKHVYIHQEKRWMAHIREMVPKIYAAFCLILFREYGFTFDQIVTVLAKTQDLWQRDGDNGFDIIKTCSRETGINLMSKVTADALGEEGDATI